MNVTQKDISVKKKKKEELTQTKPFQKHYGKDSSHQSTTIIITM